MTRYVHKPFSDRFSPRPRVVHTAMTLAAFAGLIVLAMFAGPAVAQDEDLNGEYRAALSMMDDVKALPEVFEACPADIYKSQMSLRYRIFGFKRPNLFSACKDDPVSCARACFQDRSPNHCFYTSRVFQEVDFGQSDDQYQRLFAFACAVGSPSGCTNRGAGIRNAPLSVDPQVVRPQAEIDDCLFRTFAAACADGTAWGCSMSGQTYELGEGVEANRAAALKLYNKACALADRQSHPSCQFARRGIERLGE